MFRFTLIVCVSLIFGITAKPYKPWDKLEDEGFQDTVVSIDDQGKMSWGVEVEPPEDMDETHYDVDPRMMIWKSMSGQDVQPQRAEEDLDELYHPSVADLLKVQIQNMDAAIKEEPVQEVVEHKQEAEEDRDDIDHPFFKVSLEEPEQDWDEVYHKANEELGGYQVSLVAEHEEGAEVRVAHSEPEEDLDDLYHKDLLQPVLYRDDTNPAAPVDLLSQMKYSEPEEDLDDLYHQ